MLIWTHTVLLELGFRVWGTFGFRVKSFRLKSLEFSFGI
jgi:hypothetical protein